MDEKANWAAKGANSPGGEVAVDLMLEELGVAVREHIKSEKPDEKRYPYRHKKLTVELALTGGEALTFRVPSYDLSRWDVTILHNGYVYDGTRCRVQLVTVHNNWHTADGTVIRCRHLQGRVHVLWVRFDRPVDVAAFALSAVPRHILLVDDQTSIQRLVTHYLERMNAQVTCSTDGEDALQKALSRVFNVILMDIRMPGIDGLGVLKNLRDRGYQGKVVALTGMTGPGDRERLMEAGFDGYLPKPITQEALSGFLQSLDQEPLFSTLANETDMKELINNFVNELGAQIRGIEEAMANQDLDLLLELATDLKGEAGGYGFEPITEAARALEDEAANAAGMENIKHKVDALLGLCRLARPVST